MSDKPESVTYDNSGRLGVYGTKSGLSRECEELLANWQLSADSIKDERNHVVIRIPGGVRILTVSPSISVWDLGMMLDYGANKFEVGVEHGEDNIRHAIRELLQVIRW